MIKRDFENEKIKRKPEWLKVKAFGGEEYNRIQTLLKSQGLHTVCQSANCPNRGECFSRGTATFLILGSVCTRNCRFCDVSPGRPANPDPEEPIRVANTALELNLKHVVITSVTRDDLQDGGAKQFALVINSIRDRLPESTIEVLTPDFKGSQEALKIVMRAKPDIFNHNIETVPRLYESVRPQANYDRSLKLLHDAKHDYQATTKSGVMVGLGETIEELALLFNDLASVSVSYLTIGQYLSPSKEHYPVKRFLHPDEFDELRKLAISSGIKNVFSGPLVRSSYMADRQYNR